LSVAAGSKKKAEESADEEPEPKKLK